tara:strand:- start:162 stop:326 length:165 start_codon:yes stop_codon:yes gene_type:complete
MAVAGTFFPADPVSSLGGLYPRAGSCSNQVLRTDVVITALKMPDRDGVQVIRRL